MKSEKMIVDPKITAIAPGRLPRRWGVRGVFCNDEACEAWLKRIRADNAPEHTALLLQNYQLLLDRISVETFISLGPGGSDTDIRLLSSMPNGDEILYIPVDLSSRLLYASCEMADAYHKPVAVLGDYEEGMDFISNAVRPHIKGRALFSSLGNGFGNLDMGESNFLRNLTLATLEEEHLLLSVAVGRFDERATTDPQRIASSDSLRELVAGGVSMATGEKYPSVLARLESRIDVRIGFSDIPGATAIEFWDRPTKICILAARRYDADQLCTWIEQTFPWESCGFTSTPTSVEDLSVGTFIFRRIEKAGE